MAKTRFGLTEKAFLLLPEQGTDININEIVTDPDWLDALIHLCSPATRAQFEKHIGYNATYTQKTELLASLQFHYAALSGQLQDINPVFNLPEDQKKAIIDKLTECIQNCTPGFHERVDSIFEQYFPTITIDRVLESIRRHIVERVATQVTDEVHANNRFFKDALNMGLGVHSKVRNTPAYTYRYLANETLLNVFKQQYQPFAILLDMKARIGSQFHCYTGRNESPEGYTIKYYEAGLDYLKTLFEKETVNGDHLLLDDTTGVVRDINWNAILHALWTHFIEKAYFDYEVTPRSHPYNLDNPGYFVSARDNQPSSQYEAAISLAGELFLDPAAALHKPVEKLVLLFASATDCFAYIECNPDLPHEVKLKIIFAFLAETFQNNASEAEISEDQFWQFAVQNSAFTWNSGATFVNKYPGKLRDFVAKMMDYDTFPNELTRQAGTLKGLALKLKFLQPDHLSDILINHNSAGKSNLFSAIMACRSNGDALIDFLYFTNTLEDYQLSSLMHEQDADRYDRNYTNNRRTQNIWDLTLCMGKNSPAAAASLLTIMLRMSESDQRFFVNRTLSDNGHAIHSPNLVCFKRLLQLNRFVNAMDKKSAEYIALKILQEELISTLSSYYDNTKQENAFSSLQEKWQAATSKAAITMSKYGDWKTFFANLLLSLLSIPLLGLPLVFNYYRTNGKHVFFQTRELDVVEKLGETQSRYFTQLKS